MHHRKPALKPRARNEIDEFQDDWDALDDIENDRDGGASNGPARKKWLPDDMEPVLEEPGKWSVLADVLMEIEHEIISRPLLLSGSRECCRRNRSDAVSVTNLGEPGTNVVLVMVGDSRTAAFLQDFLSTMHINNQYPGRTTLERRLKSYLYFKSRLHKMDKRASGAKGTEKERDQDAGEGMSEALKLKDQQRALARQARRRVRGGAPPTVGGGERERKRELDRAGMIPSEVAIEVEAEAIAEL